MGSEGGETPGCLSAGAGLECCYEKVDKIVSRAFLRVHVPPISIPGYPFQNGFSQLLAFSVEAKCVSLIVNICLLVPEGQGYRFPDVSLSVSSAIPLALRTFEKNLAIFDEISGLK